MTAGLAEDKLKDLNSPSRSTTEALIRAESQNILLSSRLSAYRKESGNRRPDFAKAYDELVERLNMIDQGRVGPGLGKLMPEFNLPDENGRLISLSSLLRFGPVVISINRGHWCPYCKLELRSLAAIHSEIAQLGAGVISIMPDGAQFTG
ncbi:MAG: redoxin domain-containing protein, partial [Pseudolabrys sp.]